MRFITGAAVGAAVGYVLGAKAGREQYDRLTAFAESAFPSEQISHLVDVEKVKSVIGSGMAHASEAIRNATG
ncbi:MAG: hypothetical protein OEM97_01285 [Acidimicrobiia bacterium]|nr:hypothetical protein [Acidimicrobiia bacterium]